jgi:hypothetical protein
MMECDEIRQTVDGVKALEDAINAFMDASGQVHRPTVMMLPEGQPIQARPSRAECERRLYDAFPALYRALMDVLRLVKMSGLFWKCYEREFYREAEYSRLLDSWHSMDFETVEAALTLLDIYEKYAPIEVQRIAYAHHREWSIVNLTRLGKSLARTPQHAAIDAAPQPEEG